MFIQVQLLHGFKKPLSYQVPDDWQTNNLLHSLVRVPLRNRVEIGLITAILDKTDNNAPFTIKKALSREPFPADRHYYHFIQDVSNYYCLEPIDLINRIRQFIVKQNSEDLDPLLFVHKPIHPITTDQKEITLTQEQHNVYQFVAHKITEQVYAPALLHGVTGSGKTEVYKKLIVHTLAEQKSVLLLLPEVTLATQFTHLLRSQLPSTIIIHGFHSATGAPEKKQLWKHLLTNTPIVIVGVHLPVLLPIANLGLIIIDEEHEAGYQEKKHPKLNSKEAALMRANRRNIPILLGSATPSFSSLYNVHAHRWHFFQLKNRFAGSFPTITTALLTENKHRTHFWITTALQQAITQRLHKKEQTIIFINRRGFSFFVQCQQCEFIFYCDACSVSLTLHKDNNLRCHYCSFQRIMPSCCPKCTAPEKQFLKKGLGTQQAVALLQKIFPHARIERADMDATINKKKWQQTVTDFYNQNIDILVGTQTITKGYHFPNVTLIGILWADLNIHLPFYNATETALQQLIQVSGRAGRQKNDSQVIVQSMADHPVFEYVHEINYLQFFQQDMLARKEVGYPPFVRFIEIEIKNEDECAVEAEAEAIAQLLRQKAENFPDTIVLGPSKLSVHMIKKMHSRKIYIKTNSMLIAIHLFKIISAYDYTSALFFTPNPMK